MNILSTAIEIEGPDKTGKDTIAKYIEQLGNYAYNINVRGILTQLVYNDKFKRGYLYNIMYKPIIILLIVNEVDSEIRCRMNGEPKINLNKDIEVYVHYAKRLEDEGLAIVYRYDTSLLTPYRIATDIIEKVSKLDKDDLYLEKPNYIASDNLYTEDDLDCEDVYYSALETEYICDDTAELPDLKGPKYLECNDLNGNTWYHNNWTGEDLPIGQVPIDFHK